MEWKQKISMIAMKSIAIEMIHQWRQKAMEINWRLETRISLPVSYTNHVPNLSKKNRTTNVIDESEHNMKRE